MGNRGGKISIKTKSLFVSFVLLFFFIVGATSAVDLNNVSNTENLNLMADDVDSISVRDNLEVPMGDSISQNNMVDSHENFSNYSDNSNLSSYENNYEDIHASDFMEIDNSKKSNLLSVSAGDNLISASSKISVKVTMSDTHYSKSATYFRVTLKDVNGKVIASQKVSLKINGVTYTATTSINGIATVKTAALPVGSYSIYVKYAGSSKYNSLTTTKKVKVLSSISPNITSSCYGYVSKHTIKFWKNNNVLAKTKVSIKIGSVTYTKTTDEKGIVYLSINLYPGKHIISISNPSSGETVDVEYISLKDNTTIKPSLSTTYIEPNKKYSYKVTLKSNHGFLLSNRTVVFNINDKEYTVNTDSKGVATLTIPGMDIGKYSINFTFAGDKHFSASSGSGKITVRTPTTKLTSSTLNMVYKDGSKFKVKLTKNGKALANKYVKFVFNGKTYTVKTTAYGNAYLKIPDLKPGTSSIKFYYLTNGYADYCYGSDKVIIAKQTVTISANDLVMKYRDGSYFKVVVKTKSGTPLKNIGVKFTVKGVSYTKYTDLKGEAKLKIGLTFGDYPISAVVSNDYYKSSTVKKHIIVKGTKMTGENIYVSIGSKVSYSVKVTDANKKPVKNVKITFNINGNKYSATSDLNGIAKVSLGVLSGGNHVIKYSQGVYTESSTITVVSSVTINQIIAASQNVKSYINKNYKLPATVKIGSITYTTNEYLYLASKAIVNLKANNKSPISIKHVGGPSSPSSTYSSGNLKDYLSVAKNLIKTADAEGKVPNVVSSDVGSIGYKSLVYAFSRVISFYDDENVMPAYVEIKPLPTKDSSLMAYLAATANCQVNSTKIKLLVDKLTKDLTSEKSKAKAIFNYVRDHISYSFYYDTKYGAVGTLESGNGNCVDHAHLLAAMFRTAGLATKYVHGTCTFSSGSTYGHVWNQVLIDGVWTVADATSSRNSLGTIVNWNTGSYSLHGYYASLPF